MDAVCCAVSTTANLVSNMPDGPPEPKKKKQQFRKNPQK